MRLQQHPLSSKWKPMPPLELEALAEDITKHGQHEPGVILEDMVLDGWHRYLACEKAGIKFRSIEYDGDDPSAFVISKNRHRRHQTAAELALSVVDCRNWRPHGGDQSATMADRSSTAEMAEEAGVSERTIERAKAAVRAGKADAVRAGKTSLARAAGEKPKKKEPKPKKETPAKDCQRCAALEKQAADANEKREAAADEARDLQDKLTMFETTEPDEQQKMISDLQKKLQRKDGEIQRQRGQISDLNNKCNALIRQVKALQKDKK